MQKIKSVFESLSLRNKLILTLILCLVLPGAIMVNVAGNATKDVIIEDTIQNMEQKLELTGRYVSDHLENMVDITNRIQFDVEMNTILRQLSHSEQNLNPEDQLELLLGRRTIHEKIADIALANDGMYVTILLANGMHFSNYLQHSFNSEALFQEPWMERLKNRQSSQVYWLGAIDNYISYGNDDNNPYLITIVQTLRRFANEPYAYVLVSANEQVFRDILTTRATIEDSMLLDRDNIILSHADPDKIGKAFSNEYENNHQQLTLSRPLLSSNIKLVSIASYEDALKSINTLFTRQMVVQMVFFLVFLIVMLMLIRRFTKPLVHLGKVVSGVREGDLAIRSKVSGKDEIGILSESFNEMLDQINVMMERLKTEEEIKRDYEFKMLQAQIKPHFLFNILNSVSLRVRMNGDVQSAGVLNSLSALLHMTFRHDREMISVKEEVSIVEHYVAILNFRHRNTIALTIDLPSVCEEEQIPRLFLQPIIENAFYHGLQQDSGVIAIRINCVKDEMVIEVEDNGQGVSKAHLLELSERLEGKEEKIQTSDTHQLSGIGLKNIYDRMKIIYGEAFHLELSSEPGEGMLVRLYIPLHKR